MRSTEQLTGALTRSAFAERAGQEIARFQRTGRPCSLVVADLDHFKAVNDAHGHPVPTDDDRGRL
ncbi:diguanylate cyclase [Novosphingobium sp. P6W]|uniref:diguanylate cyclase n=1 Tax=Novosphingobium sp. P6W TaxID=1609758 RepID=UPI0009E424FE|nr:diguanylate cyclase [Novosphingobium sp. P6W]AXB80727.1 diguanylate cyclase [Novosphingobium sp. P6W]